MEDIKILFTFCISFISLFIMLGQFTFSLPFDWDTKESEKANIGLTTFTGGQRTAIKYGKPRRVFTGTVFGDVNGFRDKFRRTVRKMTGFSQKPMVLVLSVLVIFHSNLKRKYNGINRFPI